MEGKSPALEQALRGEAPWSDVDAALRKELAPALVDEPAVDHAQEQEA
ncbi:MAG: hypothetical protein AAF645_03390 [Myxococcota bacterium]